MSVIYSCSLRAVVLGNGDEVKVVIRPRDGDIEAAHGIAGIKAGVGKGKVTVSSDGNSVLGAPCLVHVKLNSPSVDAEKVERGHRRRRGLGLEEEFEFG